MIVRPTGLRASANEMRRFALSTLLVCAIVVAPCVGRTSAADTKPPRGKAQHVVLVVWDGMRPEFVTEEHAPTLWKLAQSGVVFRNHHSIYPSLTSVNAAALATGVYPSRSGMIANWVFLPEIRGGKLARMDGPDTIEKADQLSGGKYLAVPTIAELVRAAGGRTAVAGTKTASLVHDRHASSGRKGAVTIFDGKTIPESALAALVKVVGRYPEGDEIPNAAQDAWTTRALTQGLWSDGVPEFSLLWMSDPDRSQHVTAPGSQESLGAIKSVDGNLALVLRELEAKGVRDKTDVLVTSDHGFSTIARRVDLADLLRRSGLEVATEDETKLARGQIRIAGNGGTNLYYIGERDRAAAARLVELLQQSDFASVIFSRDALPGTFPLGHVHMDVAAGPDVVMSFGSDDRRSHHGVSGMISVSGTGDGYRGTHGTLSRFDLHNTLVAAGPDFRSGIQSDLPTANTDVAATIMHILGVRPPERLDGRVVAEAMTGDEAQPPSAEANMVEVSREFPAGVWRQQLKTSRVGSTIYLDQGSGGFERK